METQEFAADPTQQFHFWLKDAETGSGLAFPNAMALATVGPDGRPSLRMVLLKSMNENCFCFFSNFESRKGRELAANPAAALCFYWEKLGRQVRVEGFVEKLSRADAQAYFSSRPRASQIGAWASPQSREISSRAELEAKVKEIGQRFLAEETIPVPDHWGGYCLKPDRFEFWLNGENRLHDRIEYRWGKTGWTKRRLAP